MKKGIIHRHGSGPVAQVSGYVDACYALNTGTIGTEYETLLSSAQRE